MPTLPPPADLTAVPQRVIDDAALRKLPIDHRAGFVLAHIDGMTNLREIIDISGMPQDEVTYVVGLLLELRAIRLS